MLETSKLTNCINDGDSTKAYIPLEAGLYVNLDRLFAGKTTLMKIIMHAHAILCMHCMQSYACVHFDSIWPDCMYAFSQLLYVNTACMQLHVCNL